MKEEKEFSSKREGYSPLPGNLKEQAEAKRGSLTIFHDPKLDFAPDHVHCGHAATTLILIPTATLTLKPPGPACFKVSISALRTRPLPLTRV